MPSTESWSVMAMILSPRCAARPTSSAGLKAPSEAVLCMWRSTSIGPHSISRSTLVMPLALPVASSTSTMTAFRARAPFPTDRR